MKLSSSYDLRADRAGAVRAALAIQLNPALTWTDGQVAPARCTGMAIAAPDDGSHHAVVGSLRLLDVDADEGIVSLELLCREPDGAGLLKGVVTGRITPHDRGSRLTTEACLTFTGFESGQAGATAGATTDAALTSLARHIDRLAVDGAATYWALPAEQRQSTATNGRQAAGLPMRLAAAGAVALTAYVLWRSTRRAGTRGGRR